MKAEKFVLEIDLGNDALQTYGDLVKVIRRAMEGLAGSDFVPESGDAGKVSDANGNRVGSWGMK